MVALWLALSPAPPSAAQSTAGFPLEPPPAPAPPSAPPPAPPPQYPAPPPYAPPPYAPPQPYAPQYPAPQPGYPVAPDGQYPGEGLEAPSPPPNPLLDPDLRYRQRLGAYQRPPPTVEAGPQRTAYVRILPRTRRWHDGFYFRFGLGLGLLNNAMESDRALPSNREFRFTPSPLQGPGGALGPVTEVAFGYSVHGLVLGLGAFTGTATSLQTQTDDPDTGNYDFNLTQFALIGPFADYYFDREGGFHVQGSPAVATVVAGAGRAELDGPLAQAHTAVGFGFMLGAGYEWWVDDQWSLGLIGRFSYSRTSGDDNRGVTWTHKSYAPALLLGATYH